MRDLCPQRQQSISLCDALDRVLHTGVVVLGELTVSVADIDLLYLGLQLVVTSVGTGTEPDSAGGYWPKPGRLAPCGPPAELAEEAGAGLSPREFILSPLPSPSAKEEALGMQAGLPASQPSPPAKEAGLAVRGLAAPGRALTAPPSVDRVPDKNGLGRLVLTLIKVLHELLERQALRRLEANSLSPTEMERLGATLMRQAQEIERLAKDLGLEPGDLNLDLGPLGKLL